MKSFYWQVGREVAPGFCLLLRWTSANIWPYVYLQFWRWSLNYNPPYKVVEFSDGI